jgi:hypothetical protein
MHQSDLIITAHGWIIFALSMWPAGQPAPLVYLVLLLILISCAVQNYSNAPHFAGRLILAKNQAIIFITLKNNPVCLKPLINVGISTSIFFVHQIFVYPA